MKVHATRQKKYVATRQQPFRTYKICGAELRRRGGGHWALMKARKFTKGVDASFTSNAAMYAVASRDATPIMNAMTTTL